MTREEITEGNKLIAEFMEFPKKLRFNQFRYIVNYDIYDSVNNDYKHYWPCDKLKFKVSWDWLMPVVEKIGADDDLKRHIDLSIEYFFSGDIYSVWLAVVEVIKSKDK